MVEVHPTLRPDARKGGRCGTCRNRSRRSRRELALINDDYKHMILHQSGALAADRLRRKDLLGYDARRACWRFWRVLRVPANLIGPGASAFCRCACIRYVGWVLSPNSCTYIVYRAISDLRTVKLPAPLSQPPLGSSPFTPARLMVVAGVPDPGAPVGYHSLRFLFGARQFFRRYAMVRLFPRSGTDDSGAAPWSRRRSQWGECRSISPADSVQRSAISAFALADEDPALHGQPLPARGFTRRIACPAARQ